MGCPFTSSHPSLLPPKGSDADSYLGCNADSCVFYNQEVAFPINLGPARSSTCSASVMPPESPEETRYWILFVILIGLVAGLFCSTAAYILLPLNTLLASCAENPRHSETLRPKEAFQKGIEDDQILEPLVGESVRDEGMRAAHRQNNMQLTATALSFVTESGKLALDKVSCNFSTEDGGVLGVMGPSGAGKSTFLDLLANRKGGMGACSGKIRFSGGSLFDDAELSLGTASVPSYGNLGRDFFGYVKQDEALLPTLTVRETLLFALSMRGRPISFRGGKGSKSKAGIVEDTIQKLGLAKVADSAIGSTSRRGLSGGEKRRVAIGVELVSSPAVLFLDEPTTGLDSTSAANLMRLLTELARSEKQLIVASLHQPRFEVFQSLGKVLFLSEGKICLLRYPFCTSNVSEGCRPRVPKGCQHCRLHARRHQEWRFGWCSRRSGHRTYP